MNRHDIVSARVASRISNGARVGESISPDPDTVQDAKTAAGGMLLALVAMSLFGLYVVTK